MRRSAGHGSFLYPAGHKEEIDAVLQQVQAGRPSFSAEYWSHPVLRNDEVIGAVVTFLDVIERRKAEREIQEGVRRREQFLAMLSHELRNPLAGILAATRVLESASWTDTARHEAGQVVARQANHMARLLDDLLDVSRITRGHITLRNELVDLRATARSAIEALGPFMAEHDTNLVVNIDDDPIYVVGDLVRLQQIQALERCSSSNVCAGPGRGRSRAAGHEWIRPRPPPGRTPAMPGRGWSPSAGMGRTRTFRIERLLNG